MYADMWSLYSPGRPPANRRCSSSRRSEAFSGVLEQRKCKKVAPSIHQLLRGVATNTLPN